MPVAVPKYNSSRAAVGTGIQDTIMWLFRYKKSILKCVYMLNGNMIGKFEILGGKYH